MSEATHRWRSRTRGEAASWAMAAAAVLAAVVVQLYTAADASGPIYYTDEVGYLSNAQLLAGVGEPRDLSFTSYYLGWSLLIVPIWWLTQDPATVYQAAVGLSVVCGLALIVPLTAIARRTGLSLPAAVTVAAVVSAAPARVLTSGYALAENLLTLVLAGTVLAAWRYAEHPTHGRAALLGSTAAMLFLTHGRTLPVLLVCMLWFAMLAVRGTWSAVTGIGCAVALAVPMYALNQWVAGQMYLEGAGREERGILRLLSLDPGQAVVAGTGQAWYAVVSWLGLSMIGLTVLLVAAGRHLRARRLSVEVWAALAVAGATMVSVVWISAVVGETATRIDTFAYGRYLDPFATILSVVGLAVVVRRAQRQTVRGAAAAAAVVAGAFLLAVVPRIPSGPGTWWVPLNVSGLLHWDWPNVTTASTGPWVAATVLAAVVLTLSLVQRRWASHAVLGVVAVVLVGGSVLGEAKTLRPFYAAWYDSFTLREDVAELTDGPVSFDTADTTTVEGGGDTVSRNAYQFWLAPRTVEVFDSDASDPPTELVIARKEWPRAEALGARKVADDTGLFDNALWVLPGDLLDELAASGGLETP
ncbi:hypothetical protein [Actinotalea sp. K2]|uniref:hypothetical protein n=1 Tax=Actinotalea sp. K2 TaxID=2939438 RepID=UPI002016D238|nr:hypothetical protein [Actinotalea sp. K2]MCL3862712.1 hypothetical protein [Actinotalea sp. K2]